MFWILGFIISVALLPTGVGIIALILLAILFISTRR